MSQKRISAVLFLWCFRAKKKSKKIGLDVLAVGKVGQEQNMQEGERREGSTCEHGL